MERQNCWEAMKCGKQPGGENAEGLVCPAALPNEYDCVNNGTHGGRFCWAIEGTLCGGKVQGAYAEKFIYCFECKFLKQVNEGEGRNFILIPKEAKVDHKAKPIK